MGNFDLGDVEGLDNGDGDSIDAFESRSRPHSEFKLNLHPIESRCKSLME